MKPKTRKRKTQTYKEIVTTGIYENGEIKLSGKKLPKKKMNVIVSFREKKEKQSWDKADAAKNFINKWSGAIKNDDLELVMEKKLEYLVDKHK